ncbi:DNA-directed RNA polymerase subunit alpha [Candidatus Endomicrobiellum trichonymphae]|uniref:DNA-directed RNA polymerase subunit alpha n=1 Tax=Endomicrobium trichonymphae TaxID=1408204 RepID=B1GZB0_ENDTX|nr:DNA-directed RNA polymerase subunit alpha [Candidatus Endomicrobium trichonymphae]BAG13592.1 DNA-directed RNA polymerase alpha chain [Candidatus Endomicrobium trichonymphae]
MKALDLEKLRKLILDEKTATKFYGHFSAGPFERGYGHTIGNSLRRILLSSLEGAAITSVKIAGAFHEFAVLKGVKEDVAQIVLNLKRIKVKLHSEGPEKLYLKVKKAGTVTAKDIEANASVEIMNPEQEIANIDNGTTLEMELEASLGKGYVLAEEMKSNGYSSGTIILDSLFSPIIKVNYEVENTRVEQTLNYDKLIIEIWTDGSVSPKDALMRSAEILRKILVIFTDNAFKTEEVSADKEEQDGILGKPVSIMDISVKTLKSLKSAGIETVEDLVKIKEEDLLNFNNLSKRSCEEIKNRVKELGLSLGMKIEDGEVNDKNL